MPNMDPKKCPMPVQDPDVRNKNFSEVALGYTYDMAVGEAKRYFYTKWLPGSGYAARNLEYELHTEKSVGKAPSIDLLFAVRGKD